MPTRKSVRRSGESNAKFSKRKADKAAAKPAKRAPAKKTLNKRERMIKNKKGRRGIGTALTRIPAGTKKMKDGLRKLPDGRIINKADRIVAIPKVKGQSGQLTRADRKKTARASVSRRLSSGASSPVTRPVSSGLRKATENKAVKAITRVGSALGGGRKKAVKKVVGLVRGAKAAAADKKQLDYLKGRISKLEANTRSDADIHKIRELSEKASDTLRRIEKRK